MKDLDRIELYTEANMLHEFKRVPRKVKKRTKLSLPLPPTITNGRDIMLTYFGLKVEELL